QPESIVASANKETMKRNVCLAALALLAGCGDKCLQGTVDPRSERENWRQWVLESPSTQVVGHLTYPQVGMESGCADQNSIELRGTADEKTATELAKIMLDLAPDHLVTSVARSDKLAYVETRVNCATEWQPGGLYGVFAFMQVRTPGERRWQ